MTLASRANRSSRNTTNAKRSSQETEAVKTPEKRRRHHRKKVRLGARSQRLHRSCWCIVGTKSRPIDSEEDVVVRTGARSTGDLSR
ncbi:hypothetical protein DY000_02005743 [Brassica cretica]|uniref:Uncharacterized protein n=1 Tax=Brassica cretica TaxID=69181 RepID=A0ABQ7C4D7_BRACR|nr:hypothetical protein DY000_02005743 [Brassica cretica]